MRRLAFVGFGLGLTVLACGVASAEWDGPREMYGVKWVRTLDRAIEVASAAETPKPILWFRVLGDLEGLT
jgi:hypothetical protein